MKMCIPFVFNCLLQLQRQNISDLQVGKVKFSDVFYAIFAYSYCHVFSSILPLSRLRSNVIILSSIN